MAELVAIACVVESSLVLASEWPKILMDYISPLLKRLGEAHAIGHQMMFRIAFVTYGTADTRPTPLLAKRFFVPVQSMTKELREEPKKLGIGQTTSGGSRGMAALEGLVAALELFDLLRTSVEVRPLQAQSLNQAKEKKPRLVCHILHIAASPADGAQKPFWNDSPKLDNVSWETLPAELKSRNIDLSIVNLRPIARFAELHSSAAIKGVTPAWFKVRPPHTLLLTGFPAEPKVSKRPAEVQSSPDTKRAKTMQSSEPSPNITNSSPTPIPYTQPTPPNPPQEKHITPPQIQIRGPVNQQAVLAKLRDFEGQIRQLNQEHATAIAQNRLDDANKIKSARESKVVTLERFKQAMAAVMRNNQQQLQQARTSSQGQSQPANSSPNIQAPSLLPQMTSAPGVTNPEDAPRGPDPQALKQLMQSRAGGSLPQIQTKSPLQGTSNSGGIQPPHNVTPEMMGQMQKLIDNQGIRPQPTPTLPPARLTQQSPAPTNSVQQQQHSRVSTWEGSLTWTGFDVTTHDRKELHAQVKLASPNGDIMPGTWPSNLTLTPSREPIVSTQDLQVWAKRTQALLCTFQPHPKSADPQTNERHFRSLIDLLNQKRIYALAAWTLPSGRQANNLLIFPFNGNGLVGTAFPTTGIPEMPKQMMPPEVAAQLQRLTPEQRNIFIAQMMRQRQLQKQQQQSQAATFQQQQTSSPNRGPPNFGDGGQFNPANFQGNIQTGNFMSMLGNSPPGTNTNMAMMSMMGAQPGVGGLHHRTSSGNTVPQTGAMTNVSAEMLQSFMQRSGAGMGPG